MTTVTVLTGKTITVTNGQGTATTYVAGEDVAIPAADAAKFIAAGLCELAD